MTILIYNKYFSIAFKKCTKKTTFGMFHLEMICYKKFFAPKILTVFFYPKNSLQKIKYKTI